MLIGFDLTHHPSQTRPHTAAAGSADHQPRDTTGDAGEVTGLLAQAAHAKTLEESQRLVAAAEDLRHSRAAAARADRDVDLAHAMVHETLTPVPVFEHHTAATDWLADETTTADPQAMQHHILAQASLWYERLPEAVKTHPEELAQQAVGTARSLAGGYGRQAAAAEAVFLDHVEGMHRRSTTARDELTEDEEEVGADVDADPDTDDTGKDDDKSDSGKGDGKDSDGKDSGSKHSDDDSSDDGDDDDDEKDSRPPWLKHQSRAADDRARAENMPSGSAYEGLPGAETSSTRAPALHQLTDDSGDVVDENDLGLQTWQQRQQPSHHGRRAAADTGSDQALSEGTTLDNDLVNYVPLEDDRHRQFVETGDGWTETRKGSAMHGAQCPSCQGHGRVAVRQANPRPPAAPRRRTAYSGVPQIDQIVSPSDTEREETELPAEVAFPWVVDSGNQQRNIDEAEKQLTEREQRRGASRRRVAEMAAREAYRQVLAGQDDSGWAGDMGGKGWMDNPTYPDGSPSNLEVDDPVYGQGGDQPNRALRPYGGDAAHDYTNNPGMDWQPVDDTHYDRGGRQQSTSARYHDDPQIAQALAFVRQRRALLDRRNRY